MKKPVLFIIPLGLFVFFLFTCLHAGWCNEQGAAHAAAKPRFTGQVIFPIYVSDVPKSTAFYRDIMAFTFLGYYDYETNGYVPVWKKEEPPNYAVFKAGDQCFGLHKAVNERQEQGVGCGRFYFRVSNLDAQHARITALGVKVTPVHSSALLRRFAVKDPDGTLIFFAETAAGAPLDPW